MKSAKFALALHGGAGNINRNNIKPEQETIYKEALQSALKIGEAILSKNGSAIDAVTAVVVFLEDNPLFNAGIGSVFTAEGHIETDAAIMDGSNLNAGAIAGVKHVKNPILLAKAVMEKSEHVLLIAEGAEQFAKLHQLEIVENNYFATEERYRQFLDLKSKQKTESTTIAGGEKFGTVGAVARDRNGHLAAATSTGGMMMKKFGRVGDSPIIGAGTYAHNQYAAVSCTGHGEYFIKTLAAYEVAAKMKYKNLSLQGAANEVIYQELAPIGGTGGLIAVDNEGNIAMPFNTPGMYRAMLKEGENLLVEVFEG